jgi:predicted O-methyltransferase YrrM
MRQPRSSRIRHELSLLREWARFLIRGHGKAWFIFTHVAPFERLLLYRLGLRQTRGAVFAEIGSYLGASACFLAAAAAEIGGGARVHCVDTWRNDGMSEGMRDTWIEFQRNTRRYASLIIPHRGESVHIAKAFTEKLDLLFLDGDHSYAGCRSDVENWLPHLKPGGLMILHDIAWAEGVERVVREKLNPLARKQGQLRNIYWAWV